MKILRSSHIYLSLILLSVVSCRQDSFKTIDNITVVPFSSYREMDGKLQAVLDSADILKLQNVNSGKVVLSNYDKCVVQNGTIYILDEIRRIIAGYDYYGSLTSILDKKGRGPYEYLSISDFDVDSDGNIWVVDGRKNEIIQYSKDLIPIRLIKPEAKIRKMKVLRTGDFLCELALWEKSSKYSSFQVVLCNDEFKIKKGLIPMPEINDDNYEFSSIGFSDGEYGIVYNKPIDDTLYVFSDAGELTEKIFFDFEEFSVPEKMKSNLEGNRRALNEKLFLTNTIVITDTHIVGIIYRFGNPSNFIVDRKNGTVCYIPINDSRLLFLGASADYTIWHLSGDDLHPGSDNFLVLSKFQ